MSHVTAAGVVTVQPSSLSTMVLTLMDSQLPDLLACVKKMPGSVKICGEIRSKIDNIFTHYEFIVDDWPDVTAVVSRSRSGASKLKYGEHIVNVISIDTDALTNLLKIPGVINWSKKNVFPCVNNELVPAVTDLAQEKHIQFSLETSNVILKITREKLNLKPVPEGLRLGSLESDKSEFINSFWKFSNDESNTYIKYLIEMCPSVGLYKNEDLLGYALTYHYGCLGMLHVLEEYRGRGYAKVIISHLTEKFQTGIDVFTIIESDNVVSIKLHESVGFEVIPNLRGQWIGYN